MAWDVLEDAALALSSTQYARIRMLLTGDSPVLPHSVLPPGRTYRLLANVSNWLGGFASTTVTVEKSSLSQPVIKPNDPTTQFIHYQVQPLSFW